MTRTDAEKAVRERWERLGLGRPKISRFRSTAIRREGSDGAISTKR